MRCFYSLLLQCRLNLSAVSASDLSYPLAMEKKRVGERGKREKDDFVLRKLLPHGWVCFFLNALQTR